MRFLEKYCSTMLLLKSKGDWYLYRASIRFVCGIWTFFWPVIWIFLSRLIFLFLVLSQFRLTHTLHNMLLISCSTSHSSLLTSFVSLLASHFSLLQLPYFKSLIGLSSLLPSHSLLFTAQSLLLFNAHPSLYSNYFSLLCSHSSLFSFYWSILIGYS